MDTKNQITPVRTTKPSESDKKQMKEIVKRISTLIKEKHS